MVTCARPACTTPAGQWVQADGEAPAKLAALGFDENAVKDAHTGTIAYGILQAHNQSGDPEMLKLKFDSMTSHDITFVGIVQTARASGLEKFPVPYVLTNCHNSLCAVGGTITRMTICLVFPLPKNMAASMCLPTWRLSTSICVRCTPAAAR